MPKILDDSMQLINTGSNYNFSAVKIDSLGASEYTLVTVVLDRSGSLNGHEADLERMLKESIGSCKKSPRAENLMARVVLFNQSEDELHGFRLLSTIEPDNEYNGVISTGGMTRLYDSVYHAIESTLGYSKALVQNDFMANGIVFIITDGLDNESSFGPGQIKELIKSAASNEDIESINVILISLNTGSDCSTALNEFKSKADITQFVDCGDVTQSKLAKLASFISRSVSSSSQALGTGGVSRSLSF